MVLAGVQHNEIDNVTEAGAVSQIAQNAGEQQRTSSENTIVVAWRAHEVIKNRDGSQCGQDDKEPATEGAAFLQLAKSDPRVFSVDKLQEPADDHALFAETKCFDGPGFCGLVGEVNAERCEQVSGTPREMAAVTCCFIDAGIQNSF